MPSSSGDWFAADSLDSWSFPHFDTITVSSVVASAGNGVIVVHPMEGCSRGSDRLSSCRWHGYL
jgi:hypothetical protein